MRSNNIGTVGSTSPIINGRGLKHRNLDRHQRADLGADVVSGTVRYIPSIGQMAGVLGVSAAEIGKHLHARNGNGNGKHEPKPAPAPESLAGHLLRATAAERLEAARALGVDLVWDEMVSPLVAVNRAAVE
jgi:hypothetical protein